MISKQSVPPPAPAALSLRDVYYILFRHKWKIISLSLFALFASLGVRAWWPVPYQSEAKLLIKWVSDTHAPDPSADSRISIPDERGANIINSEVEILTSLDVINHVVDIVGASNILARVGNGTNRDAAAGYIRRNLVPEVPKNSDVITLTFDHLDPAIPQQVLSQVIDAYFKKHDQIHRPEISEFLRTEIDEIKATLDETEKQLRAEKDSAGIISLGESEKYAGDETARIEAEIRQAQAELAAEDAIIRDRRKNLSLSVSVPSAGNGPVATNEPPPVSSATVSEYQRINNLLASLRGKEQDLLAMYTTNNALVQSVQSQITATDSKRKQMEDQNPGLLAIKSQAGPASVAAGPAGPDPRLALNEEIYKAEALQAKFQVLTNQLAAAKSHSASISGAEGAIISLQRNQDLYQSQLTYYQRRLEEARADQALGPGNSSISPVESPTAPAPDIKKFNKVCLGILAGGIALAFALPFVIELYLDQTLKRPSDVQSKLGVPFFMTLPKTNGKVRVLDGPKNVPLLTESAGHAAEPGATNEAQAPKTNGHLAPWDDRHALRPFFETLRDRLMTYFEMINLTHKPKLVAVTSCGEGAGVTTTAAGLASTLSETGESNVLLVNMNVRDGEAHRFYKGKLAFGLEDVLEKEKRQDAMVQDRLYVAKEFQSNDNLPRVLPKRFSHLVGKMKASDYDYIIFDMPPVSQISITPRLARYMDMVLLVVESEKTDSGVAKRAASLLAETKTNVGVVLNKSRDYLPRRLQHDI